LAQTVFFLLSSFMGVPKFIVGAWVALFHYFLN